MLPDLQVWPLFWCRSIFDTDAKQPWQKQGSFDLSRCSTGRSTASTATRLWSVSIHSSFACQKTFDSREITLRIARISFAVANETPVVGRAPHPLLSSCACQCARLACSVKDCFEDPLCCCSGSFVATCLVQFSSSLQWLHKANSTSYATAVCLVRQLSRCSACFCSPLWVHEEAFDFLSQLLALLCMPLGRKARGQGQKWRSFGAAVRTWPILLAFKCIWWRRPGHSHGYTAALVVDFCVSVAEG